MKRRLKFSTYLLALLCFTSLGYAQQERILVESSVDRSTITVGDPITYTLSITRAESVKVEPPEMGINLGQFEIRDYEIVEPRKTQAGGLTESYSYVISVYDVGEFEIPPVTIAYTDVDDRRREINSQAIRITVNSVKSSEAEDIMDIKPPVEISGTRNIYLWGAAALLLALCVLIVLVLWRRKRSRAEVREEELGPPRPAHEIAYEELERIEGLNLIEQGLIKEFYTEVSEVIRRYVGYRYYIITMELTTAELVDSMKEAEIHEGPIETIRSFLEECDLVKFAKFIPSRERMSELIPRARAIVDATKETLLPTIPEKKEEIEDQRPETVETEPVEAEPVRSEKQP
ncbi:MAG: BatD family protein [Gemmatimonadota bacterium]|nr:MAG: BatD family protein [Gemmatimonadota bacterium]